MESQKCMLDHSSSYSIHISCERLITSVNLEVYADTELTTTESLIKSFSVSFTHQQQISVRPRKLFQSLRIDNEVSFPTTTATETLIKSTDINTQGTYQLRSKTDLDIMAVSRLFHGIEAMTSLGRDEFNSLENSGDTLVPDVSKSQR